jgi:hypothetical protein
MQNTNGAQVETIKHARVSVKLETPDQIGTCRQSVYIVGAMPRRTTKGLVSGEAEVISE